MIPIEITLMTLLILLFVLAIDAYVFLVSLCWVLRAIPAARNRAWARGVVELADSFPNAVRARDPEVPAWLPWVATMLGLIVLRYVLVHSVLLPRSVS